MSRRYLFARDGRISLILYLCLSVILSLVCFRIMRKYINDVNVEDEHLSDWKENQKNRIQVPKPKLDTNYKHGILQNFKDRPIITKMACDGESASNRICRFKNLCFNPNTNRFFALTVDEKGLKKTWQRPEDNRLLDLTTVDDHNIFYFEFDEEPEIALRNLERVGMSYTLVTKKTFLFSRFVFNNVMHNIHDDFIGQFIMHKRYSSNRDKIIDTDNFIFFADNNIEAPSDHLYATLSQYPFIYREELKISKSADAPICFENLIVGNSNEGTWYDYGFYENPQGPITKKPLESAPIREAVAFLKKYYEISASNDKDNKKILKKLLRRTAKESDNKISSTKYISLFSRTQDRLILNEKDFIKELERNYGLPVKLVQLETLKFNEIIEIMSNSLISIGLHGAALIFAMFMPRNSILIELFPYAVPGENYSPYRTLSYLPGMDLKYKMWINKDVSMNYAQYGLRKRFDNLTPEGLLNIFSLKTVPPHVCCGNLPWMVRIYQDTVVNTYEINELIKEALIETLEDISNPKKRSETLAELLEMSRNRVKIVNHYIQEQITFTGTDKIQMFRLSINWTNPWETFKKKPSQYGIWIEEFLEEVLSSEPFLKIETCIKGTEINIWIRPYRWDMKSRKHQPAAVYSTKFTFKCGDYE